MTLQYPVGDSPVRSDCKTNTTRKKLVVANLIPKANSRASAKPQEDELMHRLHPRSSWLVWLALAGSISFCAAGSVLAAEQPALDAATRKLVDRGRVVYTQHCASCHDHPRERIPHREALRYRTAGAVVRTLTRGVMHPMAEGVAVDDIRALATFLTGAVPEPEPEPAPNRCNDPGGPVVIGPDDWPVTGGDVRNTRHQAHPGFRAADLPRLRMKWTFAYPGGASGPVVIAGGRVFLASGTGEVFSLNAETGCAHWVHDSQGLVRSVSVGTLSTGRTAVFFGDARGVVSALDAQTGAELWHTWVEKHALAKVTSPPTFYEDRVYVPMSSIEDPLQHEPSYECCTFRGSVASLDALTGERVWKSYTIVEQPKPLPPATRAGPQLYGPAGGAVWTPLTIDAKRKLVYAATGESYDDGNPADAHAIVAYDLATGARRWSRQFKPPELVGECREAGDSDCRNQFEFGAPVVIQRLPSGREILLVGQKSGFAHGLDPDARGSVLWSKRVSHGGDMGGLMYGIAVDGATAYFPISDMYAQPPSVPGGMVALDAASGAVGWRRQGLEPVCSWGEESCLAASVAAATSIPGAVFQGTADGHIRAYAAEDGALLWDFDTGRVFKAVNGIEARGGHVNGYPAVPVGGALYVTSGASTQGRPGNALLVFSVDGK